ncbi:leucine rich repeat domain-containing protein [Ditylenchus destructor]|nr:leucine rich repeat domain-containing protein [Ditylenchus destructor]
MTTADSAVASAFKPTSSKQTMSRNTELKSRPFPTLLTLLLSALLSVGLIPALAAACPAPVQALCRCVDELDGVRLNCTGVDVRQVVEVLRTQQAQLGLLQALTIRDASPVIGQLPAHFFAGLYIKRLELSHCGIRQVDPQALAGLESVLQELSLANNNLVSLPVQVISAGMTSLLKLDVSNNSIQELKAEDALPRLSKLFDINLSHNRITNVHKSFFENVKGSLQTINLGHNYITEVPAPALRGFRQLMALHLHNNRLTSLGSLSFMNLPVLSLLNLASNRIQTIHRQAFLNTPSLRFLYLTENQLTAVQSHQFSSFEQLEMLDLSNNRLEVLGNDSFADLTSVKQLYLGENRIKQIEDYAFANSSFVVIILESNRLEEVGKGMFQGATKLQQLSLKDNKIKSVDPNAFYNNGALVMVDLSHNELIDMAPATFLSPLNMLLVDLSYNKLLRVPYGAFNRRVVTVLLQENPLVCSEKVHMLQQGTGMFVPNSSDLICRNDGSIDSLLSGISANVSGSDSSELGHKNHGIPSSLFKNEAKGQLANDSTQNTAENGSSFVQAPVEPAEDRSQNVDTNNVRRLGANIRPLSTKRISTSHIDQFVDQSQFSPDANQATHSTFNPSSPIIRPISDLNHPAPPSNTRQSTFAISESITTPSTTFQDETHPTTVVDEANDPNVIYPLPVPFLTRPPKIHTAHNVGPNSNEVVITQTLPPSILIAPANPARTQNTQSSSEPNATRQWDTKTTTDIGRLEQVELQENSVSAMRADHDTSRFPYDFGEESTNTSTSSKSLPTAVVVICLSTVALVMSAVFVGMCVAKRRQVRLLGSTSGSCATGPVPPHHMTQHPHSGWSHGMNHQAIYGTVQGTLPRGASHSFGTLNRRQGPHMPLPPLQDDIYGWLYPPPSAGYGPSIYTK